MSNSSSSVGGGSVARQQRTPAYTAAHVAAYPTEYLAGIELHNAGEFHAAHDAWEERWQGEVGAAEKLFLQGLIQAAVVFHLLEIGRPGAARRMHALAKEKFARLGVASFMSLDLVDLQAQLDHALLWLYATPDARDATPPAVLDLPLIHLLPEVTGYDG